MIDVEIVDGGIRMSGHAMRKSLDGIDRACAAVSALTCSLVNSLSDLAEDEVQVEMDSGFTVIRWQELSDRGKLLVDSWFLGLADINREYNCIQFC